MNRKNLSMSVEWLTKIFFEVSERKGRMERSGIRGRKRSPNDQLTVREREETLEQNRGDHY